MASNWRSRSSSATSRTRTSATPVRGRPIQGKSPRASRNAVTRNTSRVRTATSRQGSYRATSQRAGSSSRPSTRTRADEPLRSVSVSQVHNESRYRARGATRRARAIAIAVCMVVAGLVVAGVVLFNSEVFKVEQVTVSGVEHITDTQLTDLAAVPQGTTLLNVDTAGIASRLTENPWVASVDVQRVFPNTLNLAVTERSITAVVSVTVDSASQTTERWVLSSDGMWLTKIPDRESEEGKALPEKVFEDADAALEITDIPYGALPEAGQFCDNANVENALGIIDGLTTDLADQVKSVSAASGDSTTLTLDNGIEIAFGDSSDIREKERVCLALMEEHPDKISYINVREVNKPVWRSL